VNASKCVPNSVETITLDDDLLPLMTSDRAVMKIDIQGHEIKALSFRAAGIFLKEIKVPIIFIEFVSYRDGYKDEVKRHAIDEWLKFLYGLNYRAYNPKTGTLLGRDWVNWPYDVILRQEYEVGLPLHA